MGLLAVTVGSSEVPSPPSSAFSGHGAAPGKAGLRAVRDAVAKASTHQRANQAKRGLDGAFSIPAHISLPLRPRKQAVSHVGCQKRLPQLGGQPSESFTGLF